MSKIIVPLERRFSALPKNQNVVDSSDYLELWGYGKPTFWPEIDSRHCTIVLAPGGAGKTHEMNARAKYLHGQPSSDDGDWSTTAFMVRRQREDGEWELLCHMAFLSVGQSMAESLQQASPDVRKFVDGYVDMHKKCGLRRDTLETIVALQDAVTGNAEAHEATRGGFGLQDVLAFINDLAENEKTGKEAKVTILSGNACIQLSTPHLAGKREAEGEKRLHWCNVANKRDQAPDSKMVSDLKRRFAGTLVTVAFTLDNNYVDSSE